MGQWAWQQPQDTGEGIQAEVPIGLGEGVQAEVPVGLGGEPEDLNKPGGGKSKSDYIAACMSILAHVCQTVTWEESCCC